MIHENTPLTARIKPWVLVFDGPLLVGLALLVGISLVTMYSAAIDYDGRMLAHARNLSLAFVVMWAAACLPLSWIMRAAVPLYVAAVALLIAVALFGDVAKGARRWLDLGVTRIQPSELMKIAMPLMLAWWFQKREGARRWYDFAIAAVLLLAPVLLIARQPDLGTSLLVAAAGAYVIFFAGLPWRVIGGGLVAGIAALPLLWMVMHDYQRQRVMMLLDPTSDPLGKGFHIIQSTIAVGSGGTWGKGWMDGTQAHLEFVPERTTDFILAVYAEEFGLVGNLVLMLVYLIVIGRGLVIAANGATLFARLLAGALTLIFFTYAFVNIGMVIGVLPVVGVPLPMMSYGGTAMVTLGLGLGMLMSISRQRRLVQS
ncbi:rod shape-determining protein RodA [Burkholderiaceae bacterium FT117]|uniref:rod shape-determining protein RodA n=1 Tax=Zeimonas sediminis TaxID=2944268 RepID=UPI0023430B07|nr:rod shape-determining protein RodA [Zeimonas sediminis]MCM5571504.1 rod shape-determining protein RodA [Zeimonas sediminis]